MRISSLKNSNKQTNTKAGDQKKDSNCRFGRVPKKIEYTNDFNIMKLHQQVLGEIDPNRRPSYWSEVRGLINQFIMLCPTASRREQEFGASPDKLDEEVLKEQKERIIDEYMKIVRNYFDIDIKKKQKEIEEGKCEECGGELEEWPEYYKCLKCKAKYSVRETDIDLVDTENITTRATTDKKSQIKSTITHFEGRQPPETIPGEVRQAIKDYANKNCIDLTRITKEALYSIMHKKIKSIMIEGESKPMNEFFADINLLHHEFTGTPLPDITHIRDRLIKRYEELIKVGTTPKIQYTLYRLLQLEEYPCEIVDFPSLYGSESMSTWDSDFKKLVAEVKKTSKFRW